MAWPPTIEDMKVDMGIDAEDDRDDDKLEQVLAASIKFVQRRRPEFNYTSDLGSDRPDPDADLFLGTIRLAGRWHTRRRSPDALVDMAEQGSGRIPSFDPDIDRLLRIGRHSKPAVG